MVAEIGGREPVDAVRPLPDPYELVSIRAVPAPGDIAGTNWYRYEISQGRNRITGYRDGGIDSVTQAVEAIVLGLNERRRLTRGRVHVVLGSGRRGEAGSGAER